MVTSCASLGRSERISLRPLGVPQILCMWEQSIMGIWFSREEDRHYGPLPKTGASLTNSMVISEFLPHRKWISFWMLATANSWGCPYIILMLWSLLWGCTARSGCSISDVFVQGLHTLHVLAPTGNACAYFKRSKYFISFCVAVYWSKHLNPIVKPSRYMW